MAVNLRFNLLKGASPYPYTLTLFLNGNGIRWDGKVEQRQSGNWSGCTRCLAKPEEWNEPENIDNDSFEEVRNLGRCSIILLIRKVLEIRARNEPSRRFHREGPYYRVSSKTVYTLILLFSWVPYHIQKNF